MRKPTRVREFPAPDGTIYRAWLDADRGLFVGQQFEAGPFSGDYALHRDPIIESASEIAVIDEITFRLQGAR